MREGNILQIIMRSKLLAVVFSFLIYAFALADDAVNVDLYAAKETAKKANKLVMLVLTRPATCSLCVSFKKNVLENSSFRSFAKKNLILVVIEYTRDNKYAVAEHADEQKKASKEFRAKYPEYKLLPGVFLIDPKTDADTFVQSPEVASMKAADFNRKVKAFQRELNKKAVAK